MDCEAIGYVIGDVDVPRAACSSIIDVVKTEIRGVSKTNYDVGTEGRDGTEGLMLWIARASSAFDSDQGVMRHSSAWHSSAADKPEDLYLGSLT